MRKILIIGLLVIGILISGCASKTPAQTPQPVITTPTTTAIETVQPVATIPTETVIETVPTMTAIPVTTSQSTNIVSVDIKNFMFVPVTITVTKGATVTWTNDDTVPHTVTSVTGDFDSGNIDPGATYSYTFDQTGSFEYSCTIHPNIPHGTITVT